MPHGKRSVKQRMGRIDLATFTLISLFIMMVLYTFIFSLTGFDSPSGGLVEVIVLLGPVVVSPVMAWLSLERLKDE